MDPYLLGKGVRGCGLQFEEAKICFLRFNQGLEVQASS